MRVLIAEDDALLRQGLVLLLETEGFEVVGAAGDLDGFWPLFDEQRPDAVVLDVRLPPDFRREGLEAAARIRAHIPGFPVLVLSAHVEDGYAAELLAHSTGVGYLLKDRIGDVAEFADALNRVAQGGVALDPEVVAHLMRHQNRGDPLATLSHRETEVLGLMAEGHGNTRICELLGLSTPAVGKHIGSIFVKLGLTQEGSGHRRVQAVLAYLDTHTSPAAPSE
ncbi:response regulator transcription factor [Streptomonospora salina]|uniref:DNA-binding NarL/FixJ family response regulator n=1 Tax=Streptomonospora salina TaxID=104205 RepID=A0A841EHU0_9ACTN|nr:response regulator transcription factor [Streptomonospora salina]MBB5999940.1 DNA-binding NarL/FixJ family response regulator [Streptomonospora salina]